MLAQVDSVRCGSECYVNPVNYEYGKTYPLLKVDLDDQKWYSKLLSNTTLTTKEKE